MDKPKELEFKVILDVVLNKWAKEGIPKRRNPNKEKKMTPKPAVVQEANEEELVQTN